MLEVIRTITVGLLFVLYLFEYATDLANEKNRFFVSCVLLTATSCMIYFYDVQSVTDKFSALLVAVFFVSGIYFFYAITTWIRRNAN
ncbi:hypothetical protein GCM10007941_16150 [Amphritea balenae]|nr:hypothetical protein GCM10007941_16150 [Amphritea balenae]